MFIVNSSIEIKLNGNFLTVDLWLTKITSILCHQSEQSRLMQETGSCRQKRYFLCPSACIVYVAPLPLVYLQPFHFTWYAVILLLAFRLVSKLAALTLRDLNHILCGSSRTLPLTKSKWEYQIKTLILITQHSFFLLFFYDARFLAAKAKIRLKFIQRKSNISDTLFLQSYPLLFQSSGHLH